MLLTDNEVRAFSEERMRPFAQQDDRFRGVSDYFTLSDVYFNQGRTLALTALSSWCGGLCAQSQWRVFEKLDAASGSSASGDRAVSLLRALAGSAPYLWFSPEPDILWGCEHIAVVYRQFCAGARNNYRQSGADATRTSGGSPVSGG
jgi:hypothetical protein